MATILLPPNLFLYVKDRRMNIEGTYTLQALPEEIQHSLMDQEVLRRTIPGLERLEQISENRHIVAINIKYAPLSGIYRGQVSIQKEQQPHSYRFVIESDDGPNTISGIGSVQLHGSGANTMITYKGTLTISKRGTRLSPTVTKGAAKLLLQQFFTALSDQLRADNTTSTEEVVAAEVIKQPGGDIVILPPAATAEDTRSAPIAQKIVHLLGLGADDPVQEEIWTNRIRRIGFVSGFLLLVWIGTRLPRKRL